jgi:hypothetical protein
VNQEHPASAPSAGSQARAIGALLAVLLAAGGCYRYVAVSPTVVGPNEAVRVRITSSAAARLSADLGVFSTELDGTLAQRDPNSLAVTVPILRQYRGVTLDSARQVLVLGTADIVDVRRSKLARGRTILAAAGALAGFVLLVRAVRQLTNPNPGYDGSPPPPPPPSPAPPHILSGWPLYVHLPLPLLRP